MCHNSKIFLLHSFFDLFSRKEKMAPLAQLLGTVMSSSRNPGMVPLKRQETIPPPPLQLNTELEELENNDGILIHKPAVKRKRKSKVTVAQMEGKELIDNQDLPPPPKKRKSPVSRRKTVKENNGPQENSFSTSSKLVLKQIRKKREDKCEIVKKPRKPAVKAPRKRLNVSPEETFDVEEEEDIPDFDDDYLNASVANYLDNEPAFQPKPSSN
jgi:hypothetical protein